MPSNFERMIQLAEEVFATRNDPAQISVDEQVMEKLRQMHPASLSEHSDGNGPVAWVLLIPTTTALMKRFVGKQINEKELLEETPVQGTYDAVYLCSALVLPEHRRRGLARSLTIDSIKAISRDHPIRTLFFWAFTKEGEALAVAVAAACNLPILKRHGSGAEKDYGV